MAQKIPESFKDLFIMKLLKMLDIERELVTAIPKMAEAANDPELKMGLTNHLEETRNHVSRLEEVFKAIDIEPEVERSEVIRSMISDAEWSIENIEDVNVLDSALIAEAQGVEHYEMALYGTACAWAETLGLTEVKNILAQTLEEEKRADEILNTAAQKVNRMAFEETQDVEGAEKSGIFGKKLQTGNI